MTWTPGAAYTRSTPPYGSAYPTCAAQPTVANAEPNNAGRISDRISASTTTVSITRAEPRRTGVTASRVGQPPWGQYWRRGDLSARERRIVRPPSDPSVLYGLTTRSHPLEMKAVP